MNYDIKNIIATFAQKGVDNTQYNPFAMLNLNENGHTKMLLSFLAYRDINGRYPVLQSFLSSFAKGRDKMIHYKRPSNVELQFSPCLDTDHIDGLITFEAGSKKHAVIIENKIFDAPDQPGQVRRYINLVKKHKDVALDNIWVFYITGDGNKVVDRDSYDTENEAADTCIDGRFVALSYSNDIAQWIVEHVANAGIYPEQLTAVARVYTNYLLKHLFCLDAKLTEQNRLLAILKLSKDMKKWKREEIEGLYNMQKEISSLRRNNTENNNIDINRESLDLFYNTLSSLLNRLEELAFGEFERMTANFLNTHWAKEMKKTGTEWRVAHRAVAGQNGYVQVRCVDNWGSAHLEWSNISTADMMCGTKYHLQLHVEGNKQLASEWKQELESKPLLLPKGAALSNTSRIMKWDVVTNEPIAKINVIELHELLTNIYIRGMKKACSMLINRINDYK